MLSAAMFPLLVVIGVAAALIARHANARMRLYSHQSFQADEARKAFLDRYRTMRAVAIGVILVVAMCSEFLLFHHG